MRRELGPQRLGQPAHRVLRRRVGAVPEHPDQPGGRRRRARGARGRARSSTARPRGPRAGCRSSRPPSGRGTRRRRAARSSPGCADPAAVTRTSHGPSPRRRPLVDRARATRVAHAATSADRGAPTAPDRRARRRRAAPRRARRSDTRAPRAASSRAVASPMPLEPPVITTCAPARVVMPRSCHDRTAWYRPGVRRRLARCSRRLLACSPARRSRPSRRRRRRPLTDLPRAGQRGAGGGHRRGAGCHGPCSGRRRQGGRDRQVDAPGATLFRDVPPGRATVVEVGGTAAPTVTVSSPTDTPAAVALHRPAARRRLRLPQDARRHAALGQREAARAGRGRPLPHRRRVLGLRPVEPRRPRSRRRASRSCSATRPSA